MARYRFSLSGKEIKDIVLALFALTFAFSLALFSTEIFASGRHFITIMQTYPSYFVQSLIAVGIGFILHEMSHKFVAQKYGLWAEFRAWPLGLLMAIGLALFSRGGFIFAAPGAVMISPYHKTRNGYHIQIMKPEDSGKISIVGSVTNVILATIFTALAFFVGWKIFNISAQVNAWLALFNMIPVSLLDGAKVFHWKQEIRIGQKIYEFPLIWFGFFMVCIALFGLTVLI